MSTDEKANADADVKGDTAAVDDVLVANVVVGVVAVAAAGCGMKLKL